MRIVFHGANAASFSEGFADLVGPGAEVAILSDSLAQDGERERYAAAGAIIGVRFDPSLPRPAALRLFHVPGAGFDAVDLPTLPAAAALCNCFGHEDAIAEYVMAALLQRTVPLSDADARLRQGEWTWWAGAPERAHGEIAGRTIGLLGFGHIGRAVAARARAFGMRVHVANRSPVVAPGLVDRAFPLSDLGDFWASADFIVVTVPLVPETTGMVDEAAFSAMRRDALLINVARGPVVEQRALYEALRDRRIGGAVIDTWYRYPGPGELQGRPGDLPFEELPNLLMTPHMSGWTDGTIRRRQATMAENIRRLMRGEPLLNLVRPAAADVA
ncbi:2-hydroxyacid dehydrogenase [Falsiroseomonas sp. HW251]|uniref:2-hydroxyacid dehydrogenase n=1 Tax=Falsiroseomonas sp. HW251 TaxID=3390998 RepID=UPI003D31C315